MKEQVKAWGAKTLKTLKHYDINYWAGSKTWATLAIMVFITYILPENRLEALVNLAGIAHLFALNAAKKL